MSPYEIFQETTQQSPGNNPIPRAQVVELIMSRLFGQESTESKWRLRAACRGTDTELFYSEDPVSLEAARVACNSCPVRAECLEEGLVKNERGMWGGMAEDERRSLIRKTRRIEKITRP